MIYKVMNDQDTISILKAINFLEYGGLFLVGVIGPIISAQLNQSDMPMEILIIPFAFGQIVVALVGYFGLKFIARVAKRDFNSSALVATSLSLPSTVLGCFVALNFFGLNGNFAILLRAMSLGAILPFVVALFCVCIGIWRRRTP